MFRPPGHQLASCTYCQLVLGPTMTRVCMFSIYMNNKILLGNKWENTFPRRWILGNHISKEIFPQLIADVCYCLFLSTRYFSMQRSWALSFKPWLAVWCLLQSVGYFQFSVSVIYFSSFSDACSLVINHLEWLSVFWLLDSYVFLPLATVRLDNNS